MFLAVCLLAPLPAGGQQWNDARSRALAEEATARRALQLADTGLVDYSAKARGFLTFLAQLGEGFTEPPKIVKADELALEIYWLAPDKSKQRVYARRDTLLLPTDIQYHRDHLGIIQNNFPSIIRLGDGDEVRDVPHPLSASGLDEYDFAIRDSLEIKLGPKILNVYEVRVRPRDDRKPRAIGAVFIDRDSHDVVRMAFSFTRAALKDKELDDVSVVLENGLFEGRFWLPRRQEIEIRRSGTWLDFPARGIIRGRWEICCYQINKGLNPGLFAGSEIVVPSSARDNKSAFTGRILDSLPADVRAVSDDDVRKVQEEARALVREQALNRSRGAGLAGSRVSDFVRFNRVEGLSLGAGFSSQLGNGFSTLVSGGFGFSDRQPKGSIGLAYDRASGVGVRATLFRRYRDATDEPERSAAVNSFAAQEFGSDYTDLFDTRGVSLRIITPKIATVIPSLEFALERQSPLEIHAHSASGRFEPALPATLLDEFRASLQVERPSRLGLFGFEIQGRAAAEFIAWTSRRCCDDTRTSLSRLALSAHLERAYGSNRLVLHTFAGTLSARNRIPAQHIFMLGGPITAPGYNFHSLAGRSAISQRLEFRFPVPVPSFSLGRYGKTPSTAPLAPYLNIAGVSGFGGTSVRSARTDGWFPSAGLALLPLFESLRFDVARGLRDGRWTFSFDVGRDFWKIL